MIRSLWIAKTGMEGQQTKLDAISNNLANVGTNGYKRGRRGVRGPDVPEPAPGRRRQLRAEPAAHRPAGGPGRARRGHHAQLQPGQPAADRRQPRRGDQGQRLLPGPDARRHHRLHPRRRLPGRRAAASSSPTTATPVQPGITIPANAHERDDRARRHGQRHAARPGRAAVAWASCSWPASSTRPAWSPRGENLYAETRRLGHAQRRRAGQRRPGRAAAGLRRDQQRQRGRGTGDDDPDAARLRDQLQGHPDLATRCCRGWASCDDMRAMHLPWPLAPPCLLAAAAAGRLQRAGPPRVEVRRHRAACRRGRRAAAPPANGSIFQAASYRPLFEDHRARLVGDTLTVQIVEKVSASQKSTSSIDKSGNLLGRRHRAARRDARPTSRAPAPAGSSSQHLRRQGRHREQQRLQRHHHRRRARGAAQRPPAGRRREADRRQPQRRRAALLGPGRPARRSSPATPCPAPQIANVRLEHRGRGRRPRRRPSAGCRACSSAWVRRRRSVSRK